MRRVTVLAWAIPSEKHPRVVGHFTSVQFTYGTLRDDDDNILASLTTDAGWRLSDGTVWSDLTIAVDPV